VHAKVVGQAQIPKGLWEGSDRMARKRPKGCRKPPNLRLKSLWKTPVGDNRPEGFLEQR